MNFFVPLTAVTAEQEALYTAMRQTLRQAGRSVADRRIRAIGQLRDGEEIVLRVGEPEPESGEVIMGIFEVQDRSAYYIFTPSRGLWEGEPITVSARRATAPKPFRRRS